MAEDRTFQTERGAIRYWVSRLSPSAPWLVFLPGLTADHRLFDDQMAYFQDKANCLVWDPPAHGLSRPFALDFTMDDKAEMLHSILQQEGIEHPVLVGQSMGGYVSQAFMGLYPGTAAGFVSIDSAPLQKHYMPAWEVKLLRHTKSMYLAIPWSLLKKWGPAGTATSAHGRTLMRAFMDDYSKQEYCELAAFGYKVLADAIDADRPYKIDCPAVLVCGEKDQAGAAKGLNRKWARESGIKLVWVPGAGHNSNTDDPAFVNGVIEELLDRVVAPR